MRKIAHQSIFILLLLSSFILSKPLFALEGVYSGSITPNDPKKPMIDLQVSLTRTGKRIFDPRGFEQPVFASTIVVGEEGGPYSCANLVIDFDESELNIGYFRPNSDQGSTPDFQLIGYLITPELIQGKVFSKRGTEGGIFGTFTIEKSKSRTFKQRDRYIGVWAGNAVNPDGVKIPLEISLSKTDFVSTNPSSFEFDYTPGKIASLRWNRTRHGVDQIHVDYLRNTVQMLKSNSMGEAGISIEFSLQKNRSIKGLIKGAQKGLMASFTLKPKVK